MQYRRGTVETDSGMECALTRCSLEKPTPIWYLRSPQYTGSRLRQPPEDNRLSRRTATLRGSAAALRRSMRQNKDGYEINELDEISLSFPRLTRLSRNPGKRTP